MDGWGGDDGGLKGKGCTIVTLSHYGNTIVLQRQVFFNNVTMNFYISLVCLIWIGSVLLRR